MRWSAVGKIFTVLLVIFVVSIALIALVMLQHGVSAAAPPTSAETILARTARHFAVPISARRMQNPVPLTPAALAEGRAHFADHCATCHANDGSGQTQIGQGLYPKTPDMRKRTTQDLSDGELFSIIMNGVRLTGMPAWGSMESHQDVEDTWKLVHFIRHLPRITPAEVKEMERMNPVSAFEKQERNDEENFLENRSSH